MPNSEAWKLSQSRAQILASIHGSAIAETNSKISADNAKASEIASARSEVNSKNSEDNAMASQIASAIAGSNSKISADNAKASEIASQNLQTTFQDLLIADEDLSVPINFIDFSAALANTTVRSLIAGSFIKIASIFYKVNTPNPTVQAHFTKLPTSPNNNVVSGGNFTGSASSTFTQRQGTQAQYNAYGDLAIGEWAYTTDTNNWYFGGTNGNAQVIENGIPVSSVKGLLEPTQVKPPSLTSGWWMGADNVPLFFDGTSSQIINDFVPTVVLASRVVGTLHESRLPNFSASKITKDTLSLARIPSIPESKLSANSVSTNKIKNNTITLAKLANGTAGKILGFDPTTGEATEVEVETYTPPQQTWQNVLTSRTDGVYYINTTGSSIMVSVYSGNQKLFFYVGNVLVAKAYGNSSTDANVSVVVPNGATYLVQGNFTLWTELR